jgi:gamma-glutamyltranspeptidase/glutathione hydrolase
MSGLAGFGAATCWVVGDRRVRTLAFRAAVPAGFPPGAPGLPGGAMAATAPGNLAGWYSLISAHGSRTLAEALAPAIALAREGVPLTAFNTAGINQAAASLRDQPGFEAWNAAFTEARGARREGEVLRQPELAATLEAIAAGGTRVLYGGRLGEQLVAHVRALGGCLTMGDLESVSPVWERPVSAAYRDLTVHTLHPPAQGFELLLALRILDGVELGGLERDGVAHLDTVWRALRLAAMERMAEGNPSPDALDRLLADERVARLRQRLADGRAVEGAVERRGAAEQHATSLAVGDRAGNLVCITQSLGGAFGGGVVVPGTGLCLNNALCRGGPGAEALLPGRMPTSPMAPVVAMRGRVPVLAFATPGGEGIGQIQAQALVQYVDFGLPLQDAVAAPRARLRDGRGVVAESRIAARVLEGLRERGHAIDSPGGWLVEAGGVQAVAVGSPAGVMTGAADPRRDGYVATA